MPWQIWEAEPRRKPRSEPPFSSELSDSSNPLKKPRAYGVLNFAPDDIGRAFLNADHAPLSDSAQEWINEYLAAERKRALRKNPELAEVFQRMDAARDPDHHDSLSVFRILHLNVFKERSICNLNIPDDLLSELLEGDVFFIQQLQALLAKPSLTDDLFVYDYESSPVEMLRAALGEWKKRPQKDTAGNWPTFSSLILKMMGNDS